jgi:hypothetical protein
MNLKAVNIDWDQTGGLIWIYTVCPYDKGVYILSYLKHDDDLRMMCLIIENIETSYDCDTWKTWYFLNFLKSEVSETPLWEYSDK